MRACVPMIGKISHTVNNCLIMSFLIILAHIWGKAEINIANGCFPGSSPLIYVSDFKITFLSFSGAVRKRYIFEELTEVRSNLWRLF